MHAVLNALLFMGSGGRLAALQVVCRKINLGLSTKPYAVPKFEKTKATFI